jgi:protein tyrosine phosphatase (PTP) superfamily phosphohydrolase (DUF442 family)
MKTRSWNTGVVFACFCLGVAGCSSYRAAYPPPGDPYAPRPPAIGYLPPSALTPSCNCSGPIAPPAVAQTPPSAPAVSPPAEPRYYAPPADSDWHAPNTPALKQPNSDQTSQEPPQAAPEKSKEGIRLLPPQNRKESVPEERKLAPLPLIPRFAPVEDQVSSGLKPPVDGGLDWLQASKYKTVLQVRAPGEIDADKQQVEKFGMKYLSLEAAPRAITNEVVDQFNQIVGDKANLPLFVYDKDGTVLGGLWYLHFRMVDKLSDAAARDKAASLGLKDTADGPAKEMWLAIQQFLKQAVGDR